MQHGLVLWTSGIEQVASFKKHITDPGEGHPTLSGLSMMERLAWRGDDHEWP